MAPPHSPCAAPHKKPAAMSGRWWRCSPSAARAQCICSDGGGGASVPSCRLLHLLCCWLYLASRRGWPICKGQGGWMGSCAGCASVMAAASGPGRALALLLGWLLGRLPRLLLPGRLLLLLLLLGLARLLAGLLLVHLVLRVVLLLHGKRLLQGVNGRSGGPARQIGVSCQVPPSPTSKTIL